MSNKRFIHIGKAGFWACLFFYAFTSAAQDLRFSGTHLDAYHQALSLNFDEAKKLIGNGNSVTDTYLLSLTETVELLVLENSQKFNQYEQHFLERTSKKIKADNPEQLFLQAELRLQWALIYLKFGHEFDAAVNIRNAYNLAKECHERFPTYLPVLKTRGLLLVMLGSVPEKYTWLLNLMGLNGSLSNGLAALEKLRASGSFLSVEAKIIDGLIHGLILRDRQRGLSALQALLSEDPGHILLSFFVATLAIKDGQSEYGLSVIEKVAEEKQKQLPFLAYLKGEVHLQKGSYDDAIHHYAIFLKTFPGKNYVRDAWFKTGLCYRLVDRNNEAQKYFALARTHGTDEAEADKYATRILAEGVELPVKLSKVRFATDGGFYQQASATLSTITPDDLLTKKDSVEFLYRQARLLHRKGDVAQAREFYLKTVGSSGENPWYFAANACLQLGYLALEENEPGAAQEFFTQALTYRNHEYKNSIDSKARSALDQMERR